MNGTNKKHMVTYSVDPFESTPVSKHVSMALYITSPCSTAGAILKAYNLDAIAATLSRRSRWNPRVDAQHSSSDLVREPGY